MAYMMPETIPRKATAGERLLFMTLKEHLPSDYIVYYEPEVHGRKPDYVIIGPDLGIVVLEVKDYTENTLFELTTDEWRIYTNAGQLATVKNPYKQAREYAFHIVNKLKRDKNLIQLEGAHAGNLKFKFGFGVVLTRLKQTHVVRHELHRVVEPDHLLTRDEIDSEDEAFSANHLIDKITGMFTVKNNYIMTDDDIKAVRYHLFPEVRISAEFRETAYYNDQLLLSLHNIKAMDLHQESLARQLGDRHRLIRGVAGSGKTFILASRAKMLIRDHPQWRVLVLCYGIPLSRVLRSLIDHMLEEPEDLLDLMSIEDELVERQKQQIEVRTFHEWLHNDMRLRDGQELDALLERLERGEAILPKYDAILVDEGQDFEVSWLRLLSFALNPETQSLLLVEDKAQNIFKRKRSLTQNLGLDFRGRSKVLTINYRNTAQIVDFAWDFYRKHSVLRHKVKEGSIDGMEIIPPQSTKRKGVRPQIKRCGSFQEEAAWVAACIGKLHRERRIPYSQMAVLYRIKQSYYCSYVDMLRRALEKKDVPCYWLTENVHSKRSYDRDEERVTLSTLDSAKGLDFRVVFIVNIENMPFSLEENVEREVSLFYIGMTRAMDWLFLSYSGDSAFTQYLDGMVALPQGEKPEGAQKKA